MTPLCYKIRSWLPRHEVPCDESLYLVVEFNEEKLWHLQLELLRKLVAQVFSGWQFRVFFIAHLQDVGPAGKLGRVFPISAMKKAGFCSNQWVGRIRPFLAPSTVH